MPTASAVKTAFDALWNSPELQWMSAYDRIQALLQLLVDGGGTGGGGTGTSLTQAEVQDAIDASDDINTIIALLTALPTSRLTQSEVQNAIQAATNIDGIEALLAAPIPAGENYIGSVGGNIRQTQGALIRSASATNYTAKTAVTAANGQAMTFLTAARTQWQGGHITAATAQSTVVSTMGTLRLHLTTLPSVVVRADGSPFIYQVAPLGNYIGWIDFYFESGGTGSTYHLAQGEMDRSLPFVPGTDRNIYGVVESLSTWTGANGQEITFQLMIDQY